MINFARQLLEGETEDRTFVNINQLEYFVTRHGVRELLHGGEEGSS